MKTYNILLPPGIGDIHWVIQFIYPYLKNRKAKANFKVQNHIPLRSKDYLELIDITNSVEYVEHQYPKWFDEYKSINEQFEVDELNKIWLNYWLESGKELTECFNRSRLVWEYDLNISEDTKQEVKRFTKDFENYCLIYSSQLGLKSSHLTGVNYANVILPFMNRIVPIFIGAEWDSKNLNNINNFLRIKGYKEYYDYFILCGKRIDFILELMKNSTFIYGFASGLQILATMFNIPVFMLYMTHLRKMLKTWMNPSVKDKSVEILFDDYRDKKAFEFIDRFITDKRALKKISKTFKTIDDKSIQKKVNIKLFDNSLAKNDLIALYNIINKKNEVNNILEIGTKTGDITKFLALNFLKTKIFTVDICKEMNFPHIEGIILNQEVVGKLCREYKNVECIFADYTQFSYAGYVDYFDIIYINVINNYFAIKKSTENVQNVIKRGSIIIWNNSNENRYLIKYMNELDKRGLKVKGIKGTSLIMLKILNKRQFVELV